MVGYESITPQAPLIASVVPPENASREYSRRVRNMATAQGFTEVYNYSFVTEEMALAFELDLSGARGRNESDRFRSNAAARQPAARDSQEHSRQLAAICPIIPAVSKSAGRFIRRNRELPEEVPHFVAAMYAREGDGRASLVRTEASGRMFDGRHAKHASRRPARSNIRSAPPSYRWRGEDVGRLFELHPSLGVEGRAAILDLDLAEDGKAG